MREEAIVSGSRRALRRCVRFVAVALAALGCAGDEGVPPELFGKWTTSAARYEGRAFAVTASTLTLFRTPEDSSVYRIVGAERRDVDGETRVEIEYEDGGSEILFSLGYGPLGSNLEPQWVHPAAQPEVEWRKIGSDR